jgi:Zinc carboxypeptidase
MPIALLAAAIALSAPAQNAQDSSRAPLLDDHDVQIAMARLASEHKDLVTVIPVGALPSRAGHKLEALRIAAGSLDPGRPGILLVADLDGPRVWTTGLALDHARHLAEGYATDARTKKLLDTTTIYVIPRANPDAAEARFKKPLQEIEATGTGVDNDRDGRQGEDPPCDVDGDGLVTWMRIPDPDGEWIADPADPRANVRADPKKGQHGLWKLVPEGRDTDHDQRASEDAEHDAVVNRNFPQGWKEHAPESGVFATDEPEARDLCDFVLDHKDLSLVITYGALDDFADKPRTIKDDAPFVKRMAPEGLPESDAALLEELGRRYKKVAKGHVKGEGDDHGTFQAWCRYERGIWCVNLELWSIPLDTPEPKPPEAKATEPKAPEVKAEDKPSPSDDAKRLRWIDAKGETARFVPWKKMKHPDLGVEVEIGGFAPYATIEPPAGERDEIAGGELEFLLDLGDVIPRVRVVDCEAKDVGGGVWQIEAALANDSLLPFESVAGRHSEVVRPARVNITLPKEAQLLAGNKEELVGDLAGSGGRKKLRWLVHGAAPSAVAVDVDSDHAGTAHVVPEVK